MADDLPRWNQASDAPEELQSLLKAAKQDIPTQAQLSGLEASLGALLDQPAAPMAPTGGSAGSLPAAAKLAVLVAVGSLVATGAWLHSQSSQPTTSPAPESQPSQAVPAPRATQTTSKQPKALPEPKASQGAVDTAQQPSALPQRASAKRSPASSKPSEASLLSRAQRALKSDPARALAITRQHKRLYPQGALSQEREVIAIEALSRLNKTGSAEQKANEFKEKYPESAHQKKVDALKK